MAFDGRQAGFTKSLRVLYVITAGLDSNPVDHLPFDTVLGTFQMSRTFRTVDERASEIAGKT